MIVNFDGYEIKLPETELASCKRISTHFIEHTKELADKEGFPTYYFTLLFTLRMMSEELIRDIGPDKLEVIMKALGGMKKVTRTEPK